MAEIDVKKKRRCISNRVLYEIMKKIIQDGLLPDIFHAWGIKPVSDKTVFENRTIDPGFYYQETREKTEGILHEDLR